MGTVDVFEINNALATGTKLLQAFATRRTLDTQQHSSVTIHGTANTSTDENHETADKIYRRMSIKTLSAFSKIRVA